MSRSKDDLEREFEKLLETTPISELDRQGVAAAMERILEHALRLGCRELAVSCLKSLNVLLPTEQWLARYADQLIEEEPSSMSYISRATAMRFAGRCRDSMSDYLMALQLEGPDGNPETLKICVAGIGALLGLSLEETGEAT